MKLRCGKDVGVMTLSGARHGPLSKAYLTNLPEDLLISILKQLPLETKCKAQAVCRTFKDILWKPSQGSSVWDSIEVDDPIFEAASPTALASWLIQRAHGIRAVLYRPGDSDCTLKPELQREYQMVASVLPQLSALLSPAAEMHLDLRFAFAEDDPPDEDLPLAVLHRMHAVQPYWLQTLGMESFSRARIFLRCPQLKQLILVGMYPLETLEGIPQGIKRVALKYLGEGSMSLQTIFQKHSLEQLSLLWFWLQPEAYDDPSMLEFIKRLFRVGRLHSLDTDCPLEKLTPLQGPQCALPSSLRNLGLHLPLERGLPLVLEQLTGLKRLELTNTGEGRMHLDRPLDPFLDMAKLKLLTFSSNPQTAGEAAKSLNYTPDASKFLGLARKRIEEGSLKPCGRDLVLRY